MVLKTVAVTGASGMLGRHVLAACDAAGIACLASARTPPSPGVPCRAFTPWDLRQWLEADQLDALFPRAQALIHVGALVPAGKDQEADLPALFDANVRACLCLGLWAASRGIPMAFVSGATVYADQFASDIRENAPPCAGEGGFYGYSKLLAENTLRPLAHRGLELVVLRPSSIYGHGLPQHKFITKNLARAARGLAIPLSSPIHDAVNLVHAWDVARALLLAITREARGVFNIPGPTACSFLEIARASIATANGGHLEGSEELPAAKPRVRFDLNGQAAAQAFGYAPSIAIETGLRLMLAQHLTPDASGNALCSL